MTRLIKLPQVQNLGNGTTATRATVRLPGGRTYNRVVIFCNGNINRALLTNLVLKVNDGEKQRWKTGNQLQSRNSYNQGASDAQVVEFDFVERHAKDEAAMTLGTYAITDGAGVQTAVIEFDVGTYTPSAASTIDVYAEVDVPSKNRLIVRTRYQQKTLSGATEEAIIIPFGKNGEQLKRIHIFGTLALIDSVRIRRDDSEEFEEVSVLKNEFVQKTYGKVPQAGHMVIDFIVHNLQGHMLNTAQIMGADGKVVNVDNLDIRLKVNGAGTFDIYTETLTLNDKP
jgi:hypothetical protein